MSKLLLDTNVLLDFMDENRPESDEAVAIFRRCISGEDQGYVCAGSLKDAYYIARKYIGEQAARDFVRAFLMAFKVHPLDHALCVSAASSLEPDFEDALVMASAEDAKVDFILTRDAAAFQATKIRSLSASQYLSIFCQEG